MISVEQALKIVMEAARPLETVERDTTDASGYVLAENVNSPEAVPSFDNSAVDGYAVKASDTRGASDSSPVMLNVKGVIAAGQVSPIQLHPGDAIRIMTGAPLPVGADAVVKVEQTGRRDDGRIDVCASVDAGENCRRAGDDLRKGQLVFPRGRRLRPYDIGVLASIGKTRVRVVRKPRVALLATGDELLAINEPLSPGKIRSSTSYALKAQLHEWNMETLDLGIARDTPEDTRSKLEEAVAADIALTTGGVSMGEFDYVRTTLESMGIDIKFWKVRQKPGKPLVFGTAKGRLFFGLPGNPASSLVCFEVYVRPAIERMSGLPNPQPWRLRARLTEAVVKKPGLRAFLRARWFRDGEVLKVTPMQQQSSGTLSPMALSNGLIDLDEESTGAGAGEEVTVLITDRENFVDHFHA
jgi:molybdopterin molybdotransferase